MHNWHLATGSQFVSDSLCRLNFSNTDPKYSPYLFTSFFYCNRQYTFILSTDISKNKVTNSLMPRTPFQFWHICSTWPIRHTALGPMLPTGYSSMVGRSLMTPPAVLTSCLVIYIFWTPYKAPGWQTICQRPPHEAGCHPMFTNTWNQFLPCQDKVLMVTTCRSGVYHHVPHMKDSQNNSTGNRLFVTLFLSNSFLIKLLYSYQFQF